MISDNTIYIMLFNQFLFLGIMFLLYLRISRSENKVDHIDNSLMDVREYVANMESPVEQEPFSSGYNKRNL